MAKMTKFLYRPARKAGRNTIEKLKAEICFYTDPHVRRVAAGPCQSPNIPGFYTDPHVRRVTNTGGF